MSRLLVVDGNNWGFAGLAGPQLSAGERDTQAVLACIRRARNVLIDNPRSTMIVLWDGRSWRHDFYSEYKANREKTEAQQAQKAAYKEQQNEIREGFRLLGIKQASSPNMEADDLAEILTKNALKAGKQVSLYTADRDWQQLVERGVNWIDLVHDKTCYASSFATDTGFKDTKLFVEAKCILGDTGDNIKGVPGIGPKSLEGIYSGYSSFEGFLECMEKDRATHIERWKEKHGKIMPKALREISVNETRAIMDYNRTLMDLSTPNRPQKEPTNVVQGEFDKEGFREFCYRNAFSSIIRHFDEFVLPFR